MINGDMTKYTCWLQKQIRGKMAIKQKYQRTLQGDLLYDLLEKGIDANVQKLMVI